MARTFVKEFICRYGVPLQVHTEYTADTMQNDAGEGGQAPYRHGAGAFTR